MKEYGKLYLNIFYGFLQEERKRMDKETDPVRNYKNGAVVRHEGNNGFGYFGDRIEYTDGWARTTFIDSFGDELVSEGGELLRGSCVGHLRIKVWGDEFDLEIETKSGTIVEMADMNIKILRKLNNFLNYALNDKLLQQKG